MPSINPNDLADTAKMTFDDEFSSLSLWNGTSGTWSTTYIFADPNGNGSSLPSNGEQEWYINNLDSQTSSVKPWTVSNGVLNITAAPTPSNIAPLINNYQYTSGLLETSHTFSQQYGYFEISAKLPAGQGLWPAFWLLPTSGAWPPELDVMEVLGNNPSALYTTVHSAAPNTPGAQSLNTTVANTSTGFHTYGVDWEKDYITWYFDGQAVYRTATPADMNQPMYMLLNLAVGGYWPGNADSSTKFPADYQIDYVRAYQSLAGAPVETSPSTAVAATGSGDQISAVGAAKSLAVSGTATSAAVLANGEVAVVGSTSGNGVGGLFSAAGASAGSAIALQAGGGTPKITALDGNMWEVTYTGSGAPNSTEVYDSKGNMVFLDNAFVKGTPQFAALATGGYVETNSSWTNGDFEFVDSSGKINWFSLPASAGGTGMQPSHIQALSDGGFVFSYANSAQLDRYTFNGGVHTTIDLASAVSGALSVAGFSDLVTEVAWVNSSGVLSLQGFGPTGTSLGGALSLGTVGANAQVQLLGTGVHDNSVALWSANGTIFGASFNGTTASKATTLATGSLSTAKDVVLTNGDIALSWLETDNGVQHAWVEVLDPTTMAVTKHDLGAASGGDINLVALNGGGFAESWHNGDVIDAVGYDGLGDYGATTTVSGDFLGVNSSGQVEAVGVSSSGQATLQTYSLSGGATSAAGQAGSSSSNYLGTTADDSLLENTAGAIAVASIGSSGTLTYTTVAHVGAEWSLVGSGDYLNTGAAQYLLENSAGKVDVGSVVNGQTQFTQVAALGSEWKFEGSGDFKADNMVGFLIENSKGQVEVGEVGSNHQVTYTQVASLGSEWSFKGVGDFLGDGHDQVLIENTSGQVALGNVENGKIAWTNVAALGSEWKFEGAGDFLGDGKAGFLIENSAGKVVLGEIGANGQVSYTTLTGLGSEWKFVGTGDYRNNGHDQVLVENTHGTVALGDVVNGHMQFTTVGALGSEWTFHG